MRKSISYCLTAVIILSLASGCTTYKPVYKEPAKKAKYGMEVFDQPEFKKDLNALSSVRLWGIMAGATAGGAYAGYYLVKPDPTPNTAPNSTS